MNHSHGQCLPSQNLIPSSLLNQSLYKEISRAAGAGGCTLDLGLANRGLEWEVSVPPFPPQWQWNFYNNWGDFSGGSDSKEATCIAGNMSLIPGLGRFPGEGNGNPLQDSCLENALDRGARWPTVHGVTDLDTTEWLTHTQRNFKA